MRWPMPKMPHLVDKAVFAGFVFDHFFWCHFLYPKRFQQKRSIFCSPLCFLLGHDLQSLLLNAQAFTQFAVLNVWSSGAKHVMMRLMMAKNLGFWWFNLDITYRNHYRRRILFSQLKWLQSSVSPYLQSDSLLQRKVSMYIYIFFFFHYIYIYYYIYIYVYVWDDVEYLTTNPHST